MFGYQNSFRPAAAAEVQYGPSPLRLAQAPAPVVPPAPPITPGQRQMAIALGAAETGFGIAATWVGVRAGMKEKGLFSALGYAVAAGGGLFAIVNLMGTLGMVAGADKA